MSPDGQDALLVSFPAAAEAPLDLSRPRGVGPQPADILPATVLRGPDRSRCPGRIPGNGDDGLISDCVLVGLGAHSTDPPPALILANALSRPRYLAKQPEIWQFLGFPDSARVGPTVAVLRRGQWSAALRQLVVRTWPTLPGDGRGREARLTCLRRPGGFQGLPRLDSNQQPSD